MGHMLDMNSRVALVTSYTDDQYLTNFSSFNGVNDSMLYVSGPIASRLMALEDLAWDYVKFSYAPGSYSNLVTKRKRYMEFCTIFQ